jgi:membrane protease YdiL (CAAX protease family)
LSKYFHFGWFLSSLITLVLCLQSASFLLFKLSLSEPDEALLFLFLWQILVLALDFGLLLISSGILFYRKWPLFHGIQAGRRPLTSVQEFSYGLFALALLIPLIHAGPHLIAFFSEGVFSSLYDFAAVFRSEMAFAAAGLGLYLGVLPCLFNSLGTLGLLHRATQTGWPKWLALVCLAAFGCALYPLVPLLGSVLGVLLGLHYFAGGNLRKTLFLQIGLSASLLLWLGYYPQAEIALAEFEYLRTGALSMLELMGIVGLGIWGFKHSLPLPALPWQNNPEQQALRPKQMSCPYLELRWQQGHFAEPLRPMLLCSLRPFEIMRLRSWLPGFFLRALFSFAIVMGFEILLFQAPHFLAEGSSQEPDFQLSPLIQFWGLGVYLLLLFQIGKALNAQQISLRAFLGEFKPGFDRHWIWKVALGLMMISVGLLHFFQVSGPQGPQATQISGALLLKPLDGLSSLLHNLFLMLTAVIAAPIVEEYFFRGLLLHRLKTSMTLPKALNRTSLFFGVIHLQAILYLAWIGQLLGLVYIHSGSLKASILTHALYNLGILLVFNLSSGLSPQPLLGLILMVAGFVLVRSFTQAHELTDASDLPFEQILRPVLLPEPEPASAPAPDRV